MCCFFGFIKWSISCIHRTLTFILGFWVVLTILYALGLAIASGVAFGYNYCLAEHRALSRRDVEYTMKNRKYVPERLMRRSGSVTGLMASGDEFQPNSKSDEALEETTQIPPTLWMYKPFEMKESIRLVPSTFTTNSVKVYDKMTKTWVISTKNRPDTKADINLPTFEEVYDAVYMSVPHIEKKQYLTAYTSLPKRAKTKKRSRATKTSVSTTVANSKASSSLSTTSKSASTSSTQTTTPKVTDSPRTDNTMPHVIRVFVPKSTKIKWRPTKPNREFFYRTSSTGQTRKTMEDAYQPNMEIRTHNRPMFGKYEGPMRHWDITTKPPEPPETSVEDNVYKNMLYF